MEPNSKLKGCIHIHDYIIDMLNVDDLDTDPQKVLAIRAALGSSMEEIISAKKRRLSIHRFLRPITDDTRKLLNVMMECRVVLGGLKVADYFVRGISPKDAKWTFYCGESYYHIASFCNYLYEIGYEPVKDSVAQYDFTMFHGNPDMLGDDPFYECITRNTVARRVTFRCHNSKYEDIYLVTTTDKNAVCPIICNPIPSARCFITGYAVCAPYYRLMVHRISTYPIGLKLKDIDDTYSQLAGTNHRILRTNEESIVAERRLTDLPVIDHLKSMRNVTFMHKKVYAGPERVVDIVITTHSLYSHGAGTKRMKINNELSYCKFSVPFEREERYITECKDLLSNFLIDWLTWIETCSLIDCSDIPTSKLMSYISLNNIPTSHVDSYTKLKVVCMSRLRPTIIDGHPGVYLDFGTEYQRQMLDEWVGDMWSKKEGMLTRSLVDRIISDVERLHISSE